MFSLLLLETFSKRFYRTNDHNSLSVTVTLKLSTTGVTLKYILLSIFYFVKYCKLYLEETASTAICAFSTLLSSHICWSAFVMPRISNIQCLKVFRKSEHLLVDQLNSKRILKLTLGGRIKAEWL